MKQLTPPYYLTATLYRLLRKNTYLVLIIVFHFLFFLPVIWLLLVLWYVCHPTQEQGTYVERIRCQVHIRRKSVENPPIRDFESAAGVALRPCEQWHYSKFSLKSCQPTQQRGKFRNDTGHPSTRSDAGACTTRTIKEQYCRSFLNNY